MFSLVILVLVVDVSFQKHEKYHMSGVVTLIEEGNFYSSYLEDAYVMNYLFSFQLIYSNYLVKVSFSKKILDKVKNTLEFRKCSYSIISKEQVITMHIPENYYFHYLMQDIYLKDKILEKLKKLSYQELLSITQDSFKL